MIEPSAADLARVDEIVSRFHIPSQSCKSDIILAIVSARKEQHEMDSIHEADAVNSATAMASAYQDQLRKL